MSKIDLRKTLTAADVKSLCDAAKKAWDEAGPRARVCRFEWRGNKFKSRLTSFRMLVETSSGKPVAARYHE